MKALKIIQSIFFLGSTIAAVYSPAVTNIGKIALGETGLNSLRNFAGLIIFSIVLVWIYLSYFAENKLPEKITKWLDSRSIRIGFADRLFSLCHFLHFYHSQTGADQLLPPDEILGSLMLQHDRLPDPRPGKAKNPSRLLPDHLPGCFAPADLSSERIPECHQLPPSPDVVRNGRLQLWLCLLRPDQRERTDPASLLQPQQIPYAGRALVHQR